MFLFNLKTDLIPPGSTLPYHLHLLPHRCHHLDPWDPCHLPPSRDGRRGHRAHAWDEHRQHPVDWKLGDEEMKSLRFWGIVCVQFFCCLLSLNLRKWSKLTRIIFFKMGGSFLSSRSWVVQIPPTWRFGGMLWGQVPTVPHSTPLDFFGNQPKNPVVFMLETYPIIHGGLSTSQLASRFFLQATIGMMYFWIFTTVGKGCDIFLVLYSLSSESVPV